MPGCSTAWDRMRRTMAASRPAAQWWKTEICFRARRDARLLEQKLAVKLDRGQELVIDVALFGEAVAFVLRHHIPDRAAVLANGFDHLLRLGHRHARIVFALHDQKRLRDLLHVGDG